MWSFVLSIAGLLCDVFSLYVQYKYVNAQTTVEQIHFNGETCPTVPLAFILAYIAVLISIRRTKMYYGAIGAFVFAFLIAIFLWETAYIVWVSCCTALILALMRIPKSIHWQFIVAIVTFLISGLWTPSINWASVRSQVARTRADMRVFAAALDSYHVEHGTFPISTTVQSSGAMWKSDSPMPTFSSPFGLTTPVAYITTLIPDPFRYLKEERTYSYYRWNDNAFILIGAGPNCFFDIKPDDLSALKPGANGVLPEKLIQYRYDSTNGVISAGDIYMVGPMSKSKK